MMPLILIKTDASASLDQKIVTAVTKKTMDLLGVTANDVALKFEPNEERKVDLYLYSSRQNEAQEERTPELFIKLKDELVEIFRRETGELHQVILHIMPKERCFRGGRERF